MADFNDWNNYGGLYVVGGVTAEAGAAAAKVAAFTTVMPSSSACTPSAATDDITVTDAGDYWVAAQVSLSGTLSETYTIEFRIDGVATNIKFTRKIGTGGDVGSASLVGILTLAAGEAVSLYQESDGAGVMTIENAQLTVMKIGWQ